MLCDYNDFMDFGFKDRDVFDSKKKVKATTADELAHKLTASQQQTMTFNRCLLNFHTNQVSAEWIVTFFAILVHVRVK